MSVWVNAIEAARMAVKMPIAATTTIASPAWPKIGFARATRYTPAFTIVAAWMRADTGVGPSIASGSQTWSGNWALLPTAPAKISSAIAQTGIGDSMRSGVPPVTREAIESRISSVPVLTKIAMIPRAKPTSPTRLTMNAFLLATGGIFLGDQKAENQVPTNPAGHQATNRTSQLSARTSSSIEN